MIEKYPRKINENMEAHKDNLPPKSSRKLIYFRKEKHTHVHIPPRPSYYNAYKQNHAIWIFLSRLYQTVTSTNRQLSGQHATESPNSRYESIWKQFAETSSISRPISDRLSGQCICQCFRYGRAAQRRVAFLCPSLKTTTDDNYSL